jgi:hypothetical protein
MNFNLELPLFLFMLCMLDADIIRRNELFPNVKIPNVIIPNWTINGRKNPERNIPEFFGKAR